MIPASGGQGRDDDQRVEPALEIDDDQQVDQRDRPDDPEPQPDEGGVHRFVLAANGDGHALGLVLGKARTLLMSPATPPRSRPEVVA
jgi:hypothetical protein